MAESQIFPKAAVKAASTVPAYALVFINLIIVLAVSTQVPLATAIVVDITVVLLSVYVIWVIELRSRRSVTTDSPEQTERVAEVRDLDNPIRSVFEDLVENDENVYVVYSSTEVKEFVNQLGTIVRPDDLTYGSSIEKRVTTIPDAVGASTIHNLLYLGGKRERLSSITSWPDDFRSDYWDANLILIGSGRSNQITPRALDSFDSPYRFSDANDAIIDVRSPDEMWPKQGDDLKTTDYGIVVKFKVRRGDRTNVYLVIAGLGPYGTLAGCRLLEKKIKDVYEIYGSSPFAYLVSVKRDYLSSFEPNVERHFALPIVVR